MDRIFKRIKTNRGVALLITLWMMVILTVMAFSFATMVRTEAYATLSYRDTLTNRYYAEAGVQRAIAEVIYRMDAKAKGAGIGQSEADAPFRIDGHSYTGSIGNGHYRIQIVDEGGKINLNAMSDLTSIFLRQLLVANGLTGLEADTIVDSILDWKDEDQNARLHGAESDYYMSLPIPYQAKDNFFEALEELLFVRGVTPEILYGDKERKGILPFLTLYSNSNQIKLNCASPEVLMSIPGMNREMMQGILEARLSEPWREEDRVREYYNILAASQPEFIHYLDVGETGIYTIHALGYRDDETKGYPVVATIMIEAGARVRYIYYQSPGYGML